MHADETAIGETPVQRLLATQLPERGDLPRLIERVVEWAKPRDDVVGLALVGSHARGAPRPGSDVDLMLVVERPGAYLEDTAWAKSFGPVATLAVEEWGAVTSLRVHYDGGVEVELGVASPAWASTDPVDPGTARVMRDGFRILLDRRGLLTTLVARLHRT